MKYVLSALAVALLVLVSGALSECTGGFYGNRINQINDQTAVSPAPESPTMGFNQKAANWAVVCGDANKLNQTNIQDYPRRVDPVQKSTNFALILGYANAFDQLNENYGINATQSNMVIILGQSNTGNQSNYAASMSPGKGDVIQIEDNFGLIIGQLNQLHQNNTAIAFNGGTQPIIQIKSNVASPIGISNSITQFNHNKAYITNDTTSNLIQIDKNLAFAISSCCSPEFILACNNTSMEGECPDVPTTPPVAPEFPLEEYPLDP